jgi:O-antigen/teichoic acid export membrane protein
MQAERSLRHSAIKLALAGGVEYALQLAMPMILVRCLDAHAFGQYRFLWLLASTVLAIAPAFMPQSLFYFLARAEPGQKRVYIGNVMVYLGIVGCVVALVTSGWNPLLPEVARELFFQTYGLSTFFLALWMMASMLDVLPTADGKARWQANATISLAVLRAVLLAGAALSTNNVLWVIGAMLLLALIKSLLLFYYIRANRGEGKINWHMATLKKQLAYSLPFAIGNALFLLRVQADEWVVVSMLSPALYATFSIAAVVLPVATLIRMPVYNAMMPRLNKAHARGDLAEISRLIAKSNGATAMLLVPVAGCLFVTAPEVVEIIYTSKYQQTVPIMQVYLIGMMMNAFAVGHVLPALNKGRFAAINSACCLVISIILSVVSVNQWGLIGAAFGSVTTFAISELSALVVVAGALKIRVYRLLAWGALGPPVFGTAIAAIGVLTLTRDMSGNVFLMLLEKGVLYLILFVPCFFLAGGLKHLSVLKGQHQ